MMVRFTALIAAFMCLLPALRNGAQMYPEDTATPLIDHARFTAFAESLNDEQNLIVVALYDNYAAEVGETWNEYREAAAALRAEADETRRNDRFHSLLQDRRRYAEAQLTQFIETVRAVVQEDTTASARWNDTIREDWHARMFRMIDPTGQELGVTNLIEVVKSIELTDAERTALSHVLRSYGDELDRIFQPLQSGYMDLDDRLNAIRTRLAGGDAKAIEQRSDAVKWYRRFNESIVELNARFTPQFSAALSADNRQVWIVAMEAASYRPLFQKSPVDAIVAALRESEQITIDTKTTIEGAYDEYVNKRDAIRVRATDVLRAWSQSDAYDEAMADFAARSEAAMNGDRSADPQQAWANNPAIPYLQRLYETEQQATRTLRSLLGAELIETLPLHVRWLLAWDAAGAG